MARLSYFTNNLFLNKYNNIFHNNIIPSKLLKNINKIKINNLFNNKTFNKILSQKNLNDYSFKINHILENSTKNIKSKSDNVKYISISTSNYSSVYIVADKKMDSIFVIFRGTSSPKAMASYLKINHLLPFNICEGTNIGFHKGVYKITNEIIHTIMESILYLSSNFLMLNKKNDKLIKIITTGHSLGVMSLIFSFNYIGLRNNKNSIYSKEPYNILDNKICCITFGSPRMMNYHANQLFNKLVKLKYIYFKRVVVLNDPIPELPPSSKLYESSYYHPDEIMKKKLKDNNKNNNLTKKYLIINNKNNVSKYYTLNSHGDYLNIKFKEPTLLDPFKEIKRYNMKTKNYTKYAKGYTICRIILGGDNIPFKCVFFILDDAKVDLDTTDLSINIIHFTDISKQDINMTKNTFYHLLHNMHVLKNNDLNPLKGHITRLYKDKIKKTNINCLTPTLKL
jgi:hypothetical protein